MQSLIKPFKQIVDMFLPNLQVDQKSLRSKYYFQISSILTTCLLSFFYIFICLYVSFPIGIVICLYFVSVHSYLLFAIKNQKLSDNQVAHIFGMMTLSGFGIGIYFTGGPESPVIYWFVTTLVVSFWFADKKTANLWLIMCISFILSIFLSHLFGHEFPVALDTRKFTFFKSMIATGVIIYLSIVLKTFDRWRSDAILELKELNQTKDRMMAIVAHDLKNPLSIMYAQIAQLKLKNEFDSKTISTFETISLRMNLILDNMLIFDRLRSQKFTPNPTLLNLSTVMQNLKNEFEFMASKRKIQLRFTGPEQVLISSDKTSLERILANLLSNSIKYSMADKSIDITWSEDKMITIQDQGVGFTPEQVEQLFKIYSNHHNQLIDPTDETHGIGLYIVNSLCRELGIQIKISSPGRNQGSTVTLQL